MLHVRPVFIFLGRPMPRQLNLRYKPTLSRKTILICPFLLVFDNPEKVNHCIVVIIEYSHRSHGKIVIKVFDPFPTHTENDHEIYVQRLQDGLFANTNRTIVRENIVKGGSNQQDSVSCGYYCAWYVKLYLASKTDELYRSDEMSDRITINN